MTAKPRRPDQAVLELARLADEDAFLCDFGGQTAVNLPSLDRVIVLGALQSSAQPESREAPEPGLICGCRETRTPQSMTVCPTCYHPQHPAFRCEIALLAAESSAERLDGRAVHAAWRDGMLAQGRAVVPERMAWETLDQRDRDLDDGIAARLAAQAQPSDPRIVPGTGKTWAELVEDSRRRE